MPGAFSGYPDAAIFTGGESQVKVQNNIPLFIPSITLLSPNRNSSMGLGNRCKPIISDLDDDGNYEVGTLLQNNGENAIISSLMLLFSPNSGQGTVSNEEDNVTPTEFELLQNYPNPFNPSTNISFSIPTASEVSLKVYDLLGREVATLINNERMQAGLQSVTFDAGHLSSGVYIYQLTSGQNTSTKKMLLIK